MAHGEDEDGGRAETMEKQEGEGNRPREKRKVEAGPQPSCPRA